MELTGQLVDILQREIHPAIIHIENGHIKSIERIQEPVEGNLPFILPGFIDSHVHIESSMVKLQLC